MNSSAPQQQYRGGGTKTIGWVIISNYYLILNILLHYLLIKRLFSFRMFSHLVSTGSQFVMEGVKNLVVKKHVSRDLFLL